MHLQIAPDAPQLVRIAAASLLGLHIGSGCTGLISGAAALAFRKGERRHRIAGTTFFLSMLTMAAIGAVVSPFLPDRLSACMGLFTFYLVATGWMTVRRPEGQVGRLELAAPVLALATAAAMVTLAGMGAASPNGRLDGQPYEMGYAFGALAAFAAALDVRMVLQGGVAGPRRIARHVWRLCFALFVASGSFFLGQPQVFPAALRGSALLTGLALAPLAFMIFWLVRVRWPERPRPLGAVGEPA